MLHLFNEIHIIKVKSKLKFNRSSVSMKCLPRVNTQSLVFTIHDLHTFPLHIMYSIAYIHTFIFMLQFSAECLLSHPHNRTSFGVGLHCVAFTCFTSLVKIALHALKHVQYKHSKPHDQRE